MTPILEADKLNMRFGGLVAVNDFSLRIAPSEIVGLIGPNGAGKTTVFNMLTGVYKPSSGTIAIGGKSTRTLSPDKVTSLGIARTFQNIRLFKEMTVVENVKVGFQPRIQQSFASAILRSASFRAEESRITEHAMALLERVGLARHADLRSANLAYGQQRRLEIARALASNPKLLLLDEPAAGANDSESEQLQQLVFELRKVFDLAILVIEHHMPFVMKLAQRVLVLDYGQTIASGTPEEIRNDRRVIEAYLGREADE